MTSTQSPLKHLGRIVPLLLLVLTAMLLTSCESNQVIVNGLEEKEANEILVFLAGKGITVNKVKAVESGGAGGGGAQMYDISVDGEHAVDAMALLNMNGLPRRKGQSLLGLFSQGGLVPSEMEEKIRYQAGLAEQIASTIRKIDGVLDADIQLSFPEEDPLNPGKKTGKVTASVYVKHQGVLDDPNTHLVTKMKRLVASSIMDLEYDNVTVIADRARFSDVSIRQIGGISEEDREYVKVWSVVIAKESLSRFRVIFFGLTITLLILCLVTAWETWKLLPLLQKNGGLMKLFSLAPLTGKPAKEDEEDTDEDEEDEEDDDEDDDEDEDDEDQENKEVT
jgi:type III secretion protein J